LILLVLLFAVVETVILKGSLFHPDTGHGMKRPMEPVFDPGREGRVNLIQRKTAGQKVHDLD
jgi:hypothetical protein